MRKFIALLALCAALVGACGGDGDKKSSDTTAAGSDTTVAAGNAVAAGGAFGDFCASKAGLTPPNPGSGADLKTSTENAAAALDQAVKHAPSDIKGDVATVAAAYKKFINAMRAANYDFTKINPQEMQAIGTSDVQAAGNRITAWVAAHCK
jgi:ABC-type phosphate/phosphonate transport system substrate-binding protein